MRTLHNDALVWDNHACMPLRPDASFLPELERLRRSGVDMVVLNVMFDRVTVWHQGVHILSFMRDWIKARPDAYLLVDQPDDVLLAKEQGKLGVAFDIEGMMGLGGELSMVQTYRDLGVRWMLIAYNKNNEAGGGCMDDDSGLTDFGRNVIREMERVGMALCCSHTGERTCMEAFEWSRNPVMLTHSNPRALVDHPRCVSDDVMKACAATGGAVGITGFGMFLAGGETSADNYFRHIDYAVQLVGPEYVALASDYVFDPAELASFVSNPLLGSTQSVPSMFNPEQFPELTDVMTSSGYSDVDVRNILGENLLRIARRVWK